MQPDAEAQIGTWSGTHNDIFINLYIGNDKDEDLSFASPGVSVLPCIVRTRMERLRVSSMRNGANCQTMSMERWQTTYGSGEKWGCRKITLVGEQIWTLVGQRVFDHSAEPPCDSWASCLG